MRTPDSLPLLCLALFSLGSAHALAAENAPAVATYRNIPVHIDARPSPRAVLADDGNRYLVYRVYLTNWSHLALRLRTFDVLDGANGELLVRYGPEQLADPRRQRATIWIEGEASAANLTVAAGRTATVAVDLALAATAPQSLRHRVTFESQPSLRMMTDAGAVTSTLVAESGVLPIDPRTPPVLLPPVRGGDWICANGLALSNSHAAIYPFRDSWLRVPQRFGCDFKKVDAEGNSLPNPFPDEITNAMFYGYGAEVLAVADGVVATVVDGIPDNVPRADGRTEMPVPFTNATGSGNWVALDIGNGRYAFYAHLQPGSIRVRVGDRVRAGAILGLLGNSGNSVGPHLHFHVGDANSLNGSEGQPYVFAHFTLLGRKKRSPGSGEERRNALPLENTVMAFPEE
jgi:hypothetical protein